MEKQKFYKKTWFIVLALLLLAPLGIFLMFKYKKWVKPLKIVLTVISLLIFIPILIGVLGDNPDATPIETPNISAPVNTDDTNTSESPETSGVKHPQTDEEWLAFYEGMFTGYVKQDFKVVAVREIVYKPQDGYITVDFDVAEGDYPVVTTQEDGEALALYACSKVANLFEHSQGTNLYPSGTEVTFNAYYLGENIFGFTFDAETIESTKWSTVAVEEFFDLMADYYIN